MPAVKNVGEPCAREPHARFDVAAGGDQTSRANTRRAVQAPLADPTATEGALGGCGRERASIGVIAKPRQASGGWLLLMRGPIA